MRIFLRLLKFLSPYRWLVALTIVLGCAMVASNMALLGMAAYVIAAAALGPLLVLLTLPIFIVRAMSVTRATSRYTERLLSHSITFRLLADLRAWVYSCLEPLAPAHLLTYRSGDVLTRLVSDVEELQNIYLRVISPIIVAMVIALLTFYIFSIFSPLLAWTALAFLVASGIGIPLLAALLSNRLGSQQLAIRSALNVQVVDGIQGVQDILAYGRADDQQQKFASTNTILAQLQRRMAWIAGLQQALNDLMMHMALWTLLVLAIPLVLSHTIDGVYLGFLALLILASFEAIQPLGSAFQFLGNSIAAGQRLFHITDATPAVIEPGKPAVGVPPSGHNSTSLVSRHTLEFDHVHFSYNVDEDEVLTDISFHAQPGTCIAIVGPSGSGKSTLANLALRFWNPSQGTIRLDGQDMRSYPADTLHAMISTVPQETYLFNNTMRANLLLAKPAASMEELELALEQAQLTDFIHQLPSGLETYVGEHGLRLSGGERQRLAIARALLKDAPVLILDEVTAHLDPLTEHAFLQALDDLMHERTTLMITHRLVAMEHMDEILVLHRGHICERGTHQQLLDANGLYRKMFDLQNGMLIFAEEL
jgi:ATP-binding cassette subfamily C protein CydC